MAATVHDSPPPRPGLERQQPAQQRGAQRDRAERVAQHHRRRHRACQDLPFHLPRCQGAREAHHRDRQQNQRHGVGSFAVSDQDLQPPQLERTARVRPDHGHQQRGSREARIRQGRGEAGSRLAAELPGHPEECRSAQNVKRRRHDVKCPRGPHPGQQAEPRHHPLQERQIGGLERLPAVPERPPAPMPRILRHHPRNRNERRLDRSVISRILHAEQFPGDCQVHDQQRQRARQYRPLLHTGRSVSS